LDARNTRVLLTDRSPESIYHSFVRLNWRGSGPEAELDVLERVREHRAAAISAIETLKIPYICESYERFASEPERVAAALSAFLSIELRAPDILFDRRHDHSRLLGRISTAIQLSWDRLPDGVRKAVKRIVPTRLRSFLLRGTAG
jgi:hypothetical protein